MKPRHPSPAAPLVSGSAATACPCRRPASAPPYPNCRGRFHAGPPHLLAPDAERLMRSRYSAYVLGLADYLAPRGAEGRNGVAQGTDTQDADLGRNHRGHPWRDDAEPRQPRAPRLGKPDTIAPLETGAA